VGCATRLVLALFSASLLGCSDAPASPKRSAQDRREAAEAAFAKTPEPRTYRFDGNELKIIDVPVKDSSGFIDSQRCFVWRDAEFRSATMSCGQMPEVLLGER
jgi:hypothetical protein